MVEENKAAPLGNDGAAVYKVNSNDTYDGICKQEAQKFLTLLAASGERKTSVDKVVLKPIRSLQKSEFNSYEREYRDFNFKKEL